MRLFSLSQLLPGEPGATLRLAAPHCLNVQDRFQECRLCVDACPADAIEAGAPPSLREEACLACRACLAACPTGAWFVTGHDMVDAVLADARRLGARRLELACERATDARTSATLTGPDVARLRVRGCLAGLGLALFPALLANGVEQVVVRREPCADCPWSGLAARVDEQIAAARRLLVPWGREDALRESTGEATPSPAGHEAWWAGALPRSRRELLRRDVAEDQEEPGDGQQPYRERIRLIRALNALPAPDASLAAATSLSGLGFGTLSVSPDCTACGACARVCPTGALRFEETTDAFALEIHPRLCLGCGLCANVCAPQAIAVDTAPSGAVLAERAPTRLLAGALRHCSKCGAGFAAAGHGGLCPVCSFREQNPFGSFIPPGAARRMKQKSAHRPATGEPT